jgi:hypothetical protein
VLCSSFLYISCTANVEFIEQVTIENVEVVHMLNYG